MLHRRGVESSGEKSGGSDFRLRRQNSPISTWKFDPIDASGGSDYGVARRRWGGSKSGSGGGCGGGGESVARRRIRVVLRGKRRTKLGDDVGCSIGDVKRMQSWE